MPNVYKQSLLESNQQGSTRKTIVESFNWLKRIMQPWKRVSDQNLLGKNQYASIPIVGNLWFFHYDPKTKDRLPYYDRFPLVMPLRMYPDGFLGLNFHYIDMRRRAYLLDFMNATFSKNRAGNMRVTYALLKVIPKDTQFKMCIKRYLFSHCESQFIPVKQEDWSKALFLPVAKFEKKSEKYVWAQADNFVDGIQ